MEIAGVETCSPWRRAVGLLGSKPFWTLLDPFCFGFSLLGDLARTTSALSAGESKHGHEDGSLRKGLVLGMDNTHVKAPIAWQ